MMMGDDTVAADVGVVDVGLVTLDAEFDVMPVVMPVVVAVTMMGAVDVDDIFAVVVVVAFGTTDMFDEMADGDEMVDGDVGEVTVLNDFQNTSLFPLGLLPPPPLLPLPLWLLLLLFVLLVLFEEEEGGESGELAAVGKREVPDVADVVSRERGEELEVEAGEGELDSGGEICCCCCCCCC